LPDAEGGNDDAAVELAWFFLRLQSAIGPPARNLHGERMDDYDPINAQSA
jgi:hypothetical protein